jgi:UDP-N-acetylmuramate dehydrogenase
MVLLDNSNLKNFNTFGLNANAKGIIPIYSEINIFEVLAEKYSPLRILGGGSNILLTGDVDAFILKNEIKGIEIIDEDENQVIVQVGAGEKWHQFVLWALSQNLAGVENLSLIPGSVGAAPMQNIGAYGVEQESVFHSLKAIHLETGVRKVFFKDECNFGYRDSIFKHHVKDQYFITHVLYVLKKQGYTTRTDYGAINDVLKAKEITQPTIHQVSEAIIEIRKSKLPDPAFIGNAGSFFKNPVVPIDTFHILQKIYKDIPFYPVSDLYVKIPAGWLIEKAGYKGMRRKNIGVHHLQALVLVNFGDGNGKDIYHLAEEICSSIKDKFDIDIEPEVNIW